MHTFMHCSYFGFDYTALCRQFILELLKKTKLSCILISRRAPHHAIHLIFLQTLSPSEWRISQLYGDAVSASLTGRELGSPAPTHQMFPTTLRPTDWFFVFRT